MTTDASKGTTDAGEQGIRSIRRLVAVNLGVVALQALSAGFLLSGDGRAVKVHQVGAVALQLGALVQAVAAVVLWRRRRVPARVAGFCVALLAIVFLEAGLGRRKAYWLHVPIGVGIYGWLTRHVSRPNE